VVLNLLSNAAKFTRNGKIIVTVASDEAAGMLSIAVRDTGMGISPDNLARLFQNFAQADATISKNFGGTGLGLALSRKLARLMGGDIDVTSDLGKGSTFTLRVSLNADMGTHDEEENDAALEQPAADPAAEPSPKALAFAS
jgi:signal transduction histidine kinase